MPLRWFECPDREKIEVKDCLKEGGCRMGNRCATRSYLQLVSKERAWTGRPSTTQLIQGTMAAFLKLTKEYTISPDSRAFMIHGTKGHANLESAVDEYSLLELKFNADDVDITGIADVIEEECGKIILSDYKTSGSYKVAKALGMTTKEEGTGEYYKSGKKAGQEKMRKILIRDENAIDRIDWERQLSKYAYEAERLLKKKIDELRIQCVVRDGNTYIARSRGVFRNVYYFKINRIPDKEILAYFDTKKKALFKALKQGFWTEICTKEENWDGIKCQRYCETAEFCKFGRFLKQQKQTEDEMIKGLSEIRRLPRLGKIRLGIKKRNAEGKEYPAEVDYFVFDPKTPSPEENERLKQEFEKLYGKEPKQINIMFPVADPTVFFAQDYKRYGSSTSLQCKGDGVEAVCASEEFAKDLEIIGRSEMGNPKVRCLGRDCPYYKNKKCGEIGILQFLLPEMPGMGIWQIATGSYHSIVNVNSCLEYIRGICGRVHMIPLLLERRAQETAHEGKKRTHYILHINMDFRLADLQRLATIDPTKIMLQLPEPEVEKEDVLFAENKNIEIGEAVVEPSLKQETLPLEATEMTPLQKIEQVVKDCEEQANAYLCAINWISDKQTWRHLAADKIERIIEKPDVFKSSIGQYVDKINAKKHKQGN